MNNAWWWQGASGAWYLHSILPFGVHNWTCGANYVAVRRNHITNTCTGLYIGETDELGRRWRDHRSEGLYERALKLGANELHVHLLGNSKRRRLDIETDLRNGHATPLNEQPSHALSGLFDLGAAALSAEQVPNAFAGLGAFAAPITPQRPTLNAFGLSIEPEPINWLLETLCRR